MNTYQIYINHKNSYVVRAKNMIEALRKAEKRYKEIRSGTIEFTECKEIAGELLE